MTDQATPAKVRLTDGLGPTPQAVAWIDASGHPHHLRHVQGVRERQLYGPLMPLYDRQTVAELERVAGTLAVERAELRHEAMRVLVAWDGTVLPKARDGLMQERMECLLAALAGLGA